MRFSFQFPVFDVINRLHNSGSFIISLCANYSPTSVSSTEALLPLLRSAGCGCFKHREPTWPSMRPNAHVFQYLSLMGCAITNPYQLYIPKRTLRIGLICLHNMISNSTMTYFFVNNLMVRVDLCVSKVKQLSSKYWCWGKEGRFDDLFKRRKRTCWFKAFKSQKQIYEILKVLWRAAQSPPLPLWAAAVTSGGQTCDVRTGANEMLTLSLT